MFDGTDFANGNIEGFSREATGMQSGSFVCRIVVPGVGWRRRCGEVHVVIVETVDGPFTQVIRVPLVGRDVFVERIFPGRALELARAYARTRFAPCGSE